MRILSLALLAGLAGEAGAQDLLLPVEVEVRGPRTELCLDARRAETRVDLQLGAEERLRLQVPLEVFGALSWDDVRGLGEEARVVGLPPEVPDWAELPRGLRTRSLPPLEEAPARPSAAHLGLFIAGALLVLASRRRPPLALAVGLAGAVGLLFLPRGPSAPGTASVLEGLAGEPRALEVRGARERLELGTTGPAWWRTLPSSRRRGLDVLARDGRARVFGVAPGSRVFGFQPVPSPDLDRARNGLDDLARAWLREAGGDWVPLGTWELGAPLPLPEPGDSAMGGGRPPGWLAAGLPSGSSALVGELGQVGSRRWVRLVGL